MMEAARVDPQTLPISREIQTRDAREIRPEVAHNVILYRHCYNTTHLYCIIGTYYYIIMLYCIYNII